STRREDPRALGPDLVGARGPSLEPAQRRAFGELPEALRREPGVEDIHLPERRERRGARQHARALVLQRIAPEVQRLEPSGGDLPGERREGLRVDLAPHQPEPPERRPRRDRATERRDRLT